MTNKDILRSARCNRMSVNNLPEQRSPGFWPYACRDGFECLTLAMVSLSLLAGVVLATEARLPEGVIVAFAGMLASSIAVIFQVSRDHFEEIAIDDRVLVYRRYRKTDLVEQRRFPIGATAFQRIDGPDGRCDQLAFIRRGNVYLIGTRIGRRERTILAETLQHALGATLPVETFESSRQVILHRETNHKRRLK